ncbi:uncharacterized protein LOC100115679 [Nasonia vitripennis]|uniref:DUF4745 domain-containing protein n=1 Tax=Nasonia vitripennis TaxID=7425 RepID=A0A7M7H7M8_NASVI|nr:uncharacterized protein LOC100115679 [Nasonia vitripennis]
MAEPGGSQKSAGDNQISHSQMDVNECLASWLTYLQMLNGLCSAGTKLALSLQALLSVHESVAQCKLTGQCLAGWEELTRATNVASHTVKKHVVAAMKDYEVLDNSRVEKHDILRDNLLTFINLQYQFCVACCKCLGSMAECSCSQDGSECDIAALQQCFERLYSSPPPTGVSSASSTQQPSQHSSHRSPLPYSLFPLQVQRRWSETAAADMSSESAEQTLRRWSMPWDCRHVTEWPRQEVRRLRVPVQDRSRSTTPDSLWKSTMTSQDGLREAIQLLSCKPGVKFSSQQSSYGAHHVPGLTLTTCSYETIGYESSAIWPDSRSVHSSKCWPHDSHSSDHSDHSGHRDSDHSVHSGEHRDSEHSGGSGSAHGDSKDSIHSHHSDYSCHRESDPGVVDLLSSRKNSSSTDSCLSAHSRSGSESAATAGESVRSNLYSMWSGSDLSFIKLPESSEIPDDSTI